MAGLASLRPVKLRLYDEMMELASPFFTSLRSHCPIRASEVSKRTIVKYEAVAWRYSKTFELSRDDRESREHLQATWLGRGVRTNARSACVSKDHTAKLLESLELTVTLNGGANLLGTRGDSEERLGLDAVGHGVFSDGGGTGHVLIRGVGARTDETDLEVLGPLVGLDSLLELADGCS